MGCKVGGASRVRRPAAQLPKYAKFVVPLAFLAASGGAEDVEGRDVDVRERGWPSAWFAAPQSASAAGIARFTQSPYLDAQNLPPVAERLPDDPVVVVPYRGIGRYGGTARIVLSDLPQFVPAEAALTISADMRGFLPNLAESWTLSEDGRVITLRLRRGIRWSDGEPLTSDDFVFSFNDLWMNDEWAPVTSRHVLGGRIVKIDDLTFQYVFEHPNPLFVNLIAQLGNFFVDPKHYFKNFHPNYVDRAELNERVRAKGFITWMAWFGALRDWAIEQSAEVPTLRPYRVASRTIQTLQLVRNPYYYKVDPNGNQLPYIDAVRAEAVDNQEVVTAQVATGHLDFATFDLRTQDIPLLKLGERGDLVKVHIWNRLHASDVAIQPNYNHPDARLRTLYHDKRFRHALSLAIDRDEMNKIIYFGRGVPRQVTAHPSSSYFEPQFATAYAEYDPDRARALLTAMGLVDSDGDGLREHHDGAPLAITLEYIDFETPKSISMDLVREYWRAVGIDLRLKLVDNGLQSARAEAGTMEMTLWHADRVTDILLPVEPWWWAPVTTGWEMCMWNDWARFFLTANRPADQRLGVAPPAHIRQLQRWAEEIRTTTDPARRVELGKNLLRANAENVWTIGTVGLAPQPVAVSSRLKNVIPNGIWGWDNRWTLSYHPPTWYLDAAAAPAH